MNKQWKLLTCVSFIGLILSFYGAYWHATTKDKPGLAEKIDSRCFAIAIIIFSVIAIFCLVRMYKNR